MNNPCAIHPSEEVIGACDRCGDFGCRQCLPNGRRCTKCAPASLAGLDKPDLGKGFKWVFDDPQWVSKVLMGAACILFSFFLVPMFVLLGYHLEIARRERAAPQKLLPDWNNWTGYLWDGLKFYFTIIFVVLAVEFVMALAFGVMIGLMVLLGKTGGGSGGGPNGILPLIAAFGTLGIIFALIPIFFAIGYCFPAIQLEYLRTGSVFSGFHFGNIWRLVSQRPGDYFMLFVGAFVTRIVGNFVGQLLCLVGILATTPWTMYTEGWLVGRYWAWLDAVEGNGP